MKFLVQIASDASVRVDGSVIGEIPFGYMVLIGVEDADTKEIADKMVKKMLGLRIFKDENGKTNLSLDQVGGSLLLISQFTLYADCKKGNRPSFTRSGSAEFAKEMYLYIIEKCKETGTNVRTGEFGAEMKVSFTNEGPFTVMLDSAELF
ncbi:MAG: D-tyrosyl-tRNA(Tyr) deacylase [Lachnospiraceae bacterium]|jgi:D-tyrosyl-tRNA(Tyr) deacylase|nr:D-tyrosyl-tRNA(Tyr) deacylase [Lachnospiraceae bacterium]